MTLKYNLLRYMISYFHKIGTSGGSYYKPLFYQYPNDANAYYEVEKNLMLGDSLKFSFDASTMDFENNKSSLFYFPQGKWCQLYPAPADSNPCFTIDKPNTYKELALSVDAAYIHMKEGSIVPYQHTADKIINVASLMDRPTDYVFGPPSGEVAKGYVAFDSDGSGAAPQDEVVTYEITSQIAFEEDEHLIIIEFNHFSGPKPGDKYEAAKSAAEKLGKFVIYDVAGLYAVTAYNEVQIFYTGADGTEKLGTARATYDAKTESVSFDCGSVTVGTEKGINVAFVTKLRVVKATT